MAVTFGEQEVRAAKRLGVKPAVTRLLLLPPINAVTRFLSRHVLPRSIGSRLPLNVSHMRYRLASGEAIVLLDASRDLVVRDLYWGKGVPTSAADARVLRCIELLCASGGTFADIGAYSGLFALLAARANPSLVAFAYEIVPENFSLVIANIVENDLVSRVCAKLLGLASAAGSIRIPGKLGLASNASSVSIGSCFSGGTSIPLATLDDESRDWQGPLVMKIDVEGYERDVFEGGRKTLALFKPDIICEILNTSSPEHVAAIEAMLRPLGYRFFHSRDEGFVEHETIQPSEAGRDWFLTARADAQTFVAALS